MPYVHVLDNKIISSGSKLLNDEILNIEVDENIALNYREYMFEAPDKIVPNPNYEGELAQLEHERIQELSIGRSDFFDATIRAFGLDEDDLIEPIETAVKSVPNISAVDIKIAMNNFKNAKDFYRKHPIFAFLEQVPLIVNEKTIKISGEQWDKFFDEVDKENPDAYKELLNGAGEATVASSNTPAAKNNKGQKA